MTKLGGGQIGLELYMHSTFQFSVTKQHYNGEINWKEEETSC